MAIKHRFYLTKGRLEKTTKIKTLIEAIIILGFSLIGIWEGFKLTIHKDPYTLYDPVGPGPYIMVISLGLTIVGFFNLILDYRKPARKKEAISKEMRIKMFTTIAVCAIYIFLISILGYLFATILFFFLQFKIEKIKSWRFNLILTIVISLVFYLLFVEYLSVIFPRGIFGEISLIGIFKKL